MGVLVLSFQISPSAVAEKTRETGAVVGPQGAAGTLSLQGRRIGLDSLTPCNPVRQEVRFLPLRPLLPLFNMWIKYGPDWLDQIGDTPY